MWPFKRGVDKSSIRVSVEAIPVPPLDDAGLRALMDECLFKAEEARVMALTRAAQLKELFRERERRAGRTYPERILEIYADREKGSDGEWKKFVADNNWYMLRAQTYAKVLAGRALVRQQQTSIPATRKAVES